MAFVLPNLRAKTHLKSSANHQKDLELKSARWAYRLVGIVVGLVGLSILSGWTLLGVDFIQIDSALPPPQFIDGLVLLLMCVGYWALSCRRSTTAKWLGISIISFGFVTLISRMPGTNFGLDRWASFNQPQIRSLPVGRPWLSSIGFLIVGISVVLNSKPRLTVMPLRLIGLISMLLGPCLLAFCFVPVFLGKRTFVSSHPPLVLLPFMTIGFAGLINFWKQGLVRLPVGRTLPGAVLIAGIVTTVILHDGLNTDRNNRVDRQVQFETAAIRQRIEDEMMKQIAEVSGLAEDWAGSTPQERHDKIGSYMGQHRSCLGVARIDGDLSLHWSEISRFKNLPQTLADTGVGDELAESAKVGRVLLVKPPRSSWEDSMTRRGGKRVLVIFTPDRNNMPENGGIICVLQLSELFETILHTNVASGYATEVTDRSGLIFSRHATQPGERERWKSSLPINFRDFDCQITVWPTREALDRENLSLPELVLGIGLLMTALLALAVHLAQTARKKASEVEAALRERESAQVALMQSEGKYRTLIENLGQGVFLQDSNHRYVAANAEFCRQVGRTDSSIVGKTESDLFSPPVAARHGVEVQTVLREGRRVESEEERIDGDRRVIIRQVLTPVRDSSGKIVSVLGICFDVTEQRQLEAHVLQASKMDAIGQLAGGIAHDFNNLLTAILGNLQLITGTLPPNHECVEFANEATTATERAASLTRRLLGFSRNHHQLNWVPIALPSVVNEVVGLLRRTIDPLVRIETRMVSNLPDVAGDPSQLHQVLMNLCLNARDAIQNSGKITIEVDSVAINAIPSSGSLHARCGNFVRLRVSDTGSGMSDEVKARIYEPFFTTKEVGKGTGLGLAMVFAIIRQHDGWIECWSELGQGTRFDLYLPCAESEQKAEVQRELPISNSEGEETILVVDDEDIVRRLASAILRSKGYTVIEAADGQEAVDIYVREQARIDLVMLDLTMPVLSGHEAFRRLLELNPKVKVIFASGYSAAKLSEMEKELMVGFVNKPYLPQTLVAAVADALHGTGYSQTFHTPYLGESASTEDGLNFAFDTAIAEDSASGTVFQ